MLLHELLKIKYPIIQGAMANIATAEFAAAVSNAGGLGILSTGMMTADQAREHILKCFELTDQPFGVNLMLMNPHSDDIAQVVMDLKPAVVTTGAGNPSRFIEGFKHAGIKVFPVVPTVSLAIRMERAGADAIIAEGTEAGGHVGEMATMALIPQVVDAVSIPVIAAGGIGDGRGLVAAFALGAVGVQVGTCLLAANECPIHENYKQALIKAKDSDTVVTGRRGGAPVRILKNAMSVEYLKLEQQGASRETLEELTIGALSRAVYDGDVKTGSLMMGQIAGMTTRLRPLKTILADLVDSSQLAAERITKIYENWK